MSGRRRTTHQRIWDVVCTIPRGRVATYGQVAKLAGLGRRARLVGYALHALPPGVPVPWQRVINARGTISLRRSGGHHSLQRKLLEAEGIAFKGDLVDLAKFGWKR
jgi:methylated-DNA-protein-cysteine methyltransferase-like protein